MLNDEGTMDGSSENSLEMNTLLDGDDDKYKKVSVNAKITPRVN